MFFILFNIYKIFNLHTVIQKICNKYAFPLKYANLILSIRMYALWIVEIYNENYSRLNT